MVHGAIARKGGVAALVAAALVPGTARQHAASPDVVFVGSTPCDSLPRQFVGVLPGAECERITWQLTLTTSGTSAPGTFSLSATYGMQAHSAPGFVAGGTDVRMRGAWTILKGSASNAGAIIYRIAADEPGRTLDFALLGDNLLHPLNEDKALMLGNPSWSYTLSRREAAPQSATVPDTPLVNASAKSTAGGAAAATVAGVFEGRTPCQEVARVLNVAASRDCTKIKWRLTLYHDSATRAPGGYKLEGFVYRNPPRTGTWAIRTTANDRRVVYQLDPDRAGGFLSLLKADGNILLLLDRQGRFLVGDIHYSYTLNRVSSSQ
jgi:hypothetical protein